MVGVVRIGQPAGQSFSAGTECIGQRSLLADHEPEGVDVMGGVIPLAPAGHVHRCIDRELARVGPHHLKQELQLVASLGVLDDI